jgi:hypothetical protein
LDSRTVPSVDIDASALENEFTHPQSRRKKHTLSWFFVGGRRDGGKGTTDRKKKRQFTSGVVIDREEQFRIMCAGPLDDEGRRRGPDNGVPCFRPPNTMPHTSANR